jgi:hypothetical protein
MNPMSRTATPANRIRAAFAAALVGLAVCAAAPAQAHATPERASSVTASGFGWDAPPPSAPSPTASPSTTPDSGFGWE